MKSGNTGPVSISLKYVKHTPMNLTV